jgi:hypothetical protein
VFGKRFQAFATATGHNDSERTARESADVTS